MSLHGLGRVHLQKKLKHCDRFSCSKPLNSKQTKIAKSCARHKSGLFIMKKKIAITLATLDVAAVAVVSLCSFTSRNEIVTDEGHHKSYYK